MNLLAAVKSGDIALARKALKAGANPNCTDLSGYSALHWACQKGYAKIVKLLIKFGADIDLSDNEGFRPLEIAINCGHPHIASIILKHAPDLTKTRNGFSYLHACAAASDFKTAQRLLDCPEIRRLINTRDEGGYTPLHWAAQVGDLRTAKLLLKFGANPSLFDINGFAPLHHASAGGHFEVVRLLVEHGVDVNQRCPAWRNGTCLHNAYAYHNKEMIQFLLSLGADESIIDNEGKRPSDWG
jgi:ankyrin repeat protein